MALKQDGCVSTTAVGHILADCGEHQIFASCGGSLNKQDYDRLPKINDLLRLPVVPAE